MQEMVSKQQHTQHNNSQVQTMIITAITLFALSGLIVGLAVGIYTRPAHTSPVTSTTNKPSTDPHTIAAHPSTTPTPTVTLQAQVQTLGCPAAANDAFTVLQVPDGISTYTFTAQAKDKSAGTCDPKNKDIQAVGITSKLWLVKKIPDGKLLGFPKAGDQLKNPDQLKNSITGTLNDSASTDFTEVSGLQFGAETQQVQQTNSQGQVKWTYTISQQITPGDYSLVILTDWNGTTENWSWVNITIKKS